jgi:Heat induced stress protein YflT domain
MQQPNIPLPGLDLDFPRSLGVFDRYEQAQKVVDFLSDNEFPVQNLAIVGTELRTVERIAGRITRGKVAAASAASGVWMGLFIGAAFALFGDGNPLGFIITLVILGAIFGAVWSQIGYSALTRGGTRDFASVSQVVATKYEVLVEHKLEESARELLMKLPGQAAQIF